MGSILVLIAQNLAMGGGPVTSSQTLTRMTMGVGL